MASLTIRNLDEDTKAQLRIAAARSGHSMEEHVRQLIAREVQASAPPARGFGTWLHELFDGTDPTELTLPTRDEMTEPGALPG